MDNYEELREAYVIMDAILKNPEGLEKKLGKTRQILDERLFKSKKWQYDQLRDLLEVRDVLEVLSKSSTSIAKSINIAVKAMASSEGANEAHSTLVEPASEAVKAMMASQDTGLKSNSIDRLTLLASYLELSNCNRTFNAPNCDPETFTQSYTYRSQEQCNPRFFEARFDDDTMVPQANSFILITDDDETNSIGVPENSTQSICSSEPSNPQNSEIFSITTASQVNSLTYDETQQPKRLKTHKNGKSLSHGVSNILCQKKSPEKRASGVVGVPENSTQIRQPESVCEKGVYNEDTIIARASIYDQVTILEEPKPESPQKKPDRKEGIYKNTRSAKTQKPGN